MTDTTDMPTFDIEQRRAIIARARQAMRAALCGASAPESPGDTSFWQQPWGLFCTLHDRAGELRGCIGTFDAKPLRASVDAMAAAVLKDPRFIADPVTLDELDTLRLTVSLLTAEQPIDDPLKMRIGIDGIVIRGKRFGLPVSGCFLPEVAAEQGWDAAATLSYCCQHKMGLSPDAWRPPTKLRFFVFQSIIIDEARIDEVETSE